MRAVLLMLCLSLAAAASFTWLALDRRVSIEAVSWRMPAEVGSETKLDPEQSDLALPLRQAVALQESRSAHVRLELKSPGYEHAGVLVMRHESAGLRLNIQGEGPRERRFDCPSGSGEVVDCRVVMRVHGASATVVTVGPESGEARISAIGYEVATAKRQTSASSGDLYYAFFGLLLAGPLLVWMRRIPHAEQIALAALGMAWIGYTGIAGLGLSVAFALGGYLSISLIAGTRDRRSRTLMTAVAGVVLVVLFVKFLGPHVAAAFANPGGFSLALPLGISYFAIRIVDLLLTAHAGAIKDLNLRDYLAFIFMPHTLPAGPIFIYGDFQRSRIANYDVTDFAAGLARMTVGVGKKTVADTYLLPVVLKNMDAFLAAGTSARPGVVVSMLLVNVAYVYLDFSAYCDIAIGAGRGAGRKIPENFDWPLARSGILSFWRHWHMTLSYWVMRRIYFAAFLMARSPFVAIASSMLVIGLWHTPNLSWAMWAIHHSVAMSAEQRWFPQAKKNERSAATPSLGAVLRYVAGVCFVWIWVGLGHSFTLFSSPTVALSSYMLALSWPLQPLLRLIEGF